MSWYLNQQDIIVHDGLAQEIPGDVITPPYPASFWYLDSDGLIKNEMLCESIDTPLFTYPYPASLWWLSEDDLLLNMLLPEPLPLPPVGGAFYNAESLEYVKIPKSVKSIGLEAFKGTKLKSVMIPRGCSYGMTTFPMDCEIHFYDDVYDVNYEITISGTESFRITETVVHDEESTTCEIP